MRIEDIVRGKKYMKKGGATRYIKDNTEVEAIRINEDTSDVYVQDTGLNKNGNGRWWVSPNDLYELKEEYPEIPIDDKPKTNIKVSTAGGLTAIPMHSTKCVPDHTEDITLPKDFFADCPEHDIVNHHNHYTSGNIECIDAIKEAINGLVGIEAFCTANAIKYLWRWKRKNGAEDLEKAKWCIDRLITELKE